MKTLVLNLFTFIFIFSYASLSNADNEGNLPELKLSDQTYTIKNSKISFTIPENFKLRAENKDGTSSDFTGPNHGGRLLGIHVNNFQIPQGVPVEIMFNSNFDSAKNGNKFVNVRKLDLGDKVLAYYSEESPKDDSEAIHRVFVKIWANGYQTQIMFAGSYKGVTDYLDLAQKMYATIKVN